MYKDKKILGIIPARGGSKGLPGKNIVDLAGKPLIWYTIKAAKASKFLDFFIVSTDGKDIEEVSKKYGAMVIKRPKELALDDSPTVDAVYHAMDMLPEKYDIIVLLEPTSPLRKKDDIDKAIVKLVDNYGSADSLVSLGEIMVENPYFLN